MKKLFVGLEKLKAFLDTEEGQKSLKDFFDKKDAQKKRFETHVQKLVDLYNRSKEEFFQLLDKVIDKYDSNEYVNREYKLGYEPRQPLFSYFEKAFQILGQETSEEPYATMFNDVAYLLDDYCARTLIGQGAVTQIQKKSWFHPAVKNP